MTNKLLHLKVMSYC